MQAAAEEKRQELSNSCERILCKKSCRRQSSKVRPYPPRAVVGGGGGEKSQDLDAEGVASRLSAASWRVTVAAADAGVCAQWDFVAIMVSPSRPMPLARSASVGR